MSRTSGTGRRSVYVRLIYRLRDGQIMVCDMPRTAERSALIRQRALDRIARRYATVMGAECPPTVLVQVQRDFRAYLDRRIAKGHES